MDGFNRRVGKSLNGTVQRRFLYEDTFRIAVELDKDGILQKEFVYGSGSQTPDYMIKDGVNYKIVTDHLGFPVLVVNVSTGQVAQRLNYDFLGRVQLDSNTCFQPFGFAGGIWDPDTKLVRFGARDYDPEVGRWTSKDPILFKGGDTNLYGYVANDPVNWIDPEGMSAKDVLRIKGIFGSTVAQMTSSGMRTDPRAWNNIQRSFYNVTGKGNKFLGCGE